MTPLHKYTLWFLLGFLGLSLVIPGLMNMLRPSMEGDVIRAGSVDGKNHLRALNAMMAAMGVLALWACFDIEHSRRLVMALGLILVFIVAARVYAVLIDGLPSNTTLMYLSIEFTLSLVFLLWPPPE